MKKLISSVILGLFLSAVQGQASLVRDFYPGENSFTHFINDGSPAPVVEHNGKLYVVAYDSVHYVYKNLYALSDLSGNASLVAADIGTPLRGSEASAAQYSGMVSSGSNLYYFVMNPATFSDHILYVYNGSSVQPLDTIPGVSGQLCIFPLPGGKAVYLGATAAGGSEPFVTDGTPAGTMLLKDINPGTANASADILGFSFGNKVYFAADDGTSSGNKKWWVTDGTPSGTQIFMDNAFNGFPVWTKNNSHFLLNFVIADQKGILTSDGTPGGTQFLHNAVAGTTLALFNHDGTNAGTGRFTAGSENMYYVAVSVSQDKLYKTQGTAGDTVLVFQGTLPHNISYAAEFGGNLYYMYAVSSSGQVKLDRLDTGTGTISNVKSFSFETIADFGGFCSNGSTLFFGGKEAADPGIEPYISDGTAAGTMPARLFTVSAYNHGSGIMNNYYTVFHDTIVFSANSSDYGAELWKLGLGGPAGISDNEDQLQQVNIYPNPAGDVLNITNLPAGSRVRLFDYTGKPVFEPGVNGQHLTIETGGFSSGIYFMRIECGTGKRVRKLVIQH